MFFRLDGSIVALKEIKLQPQEGLPFTAIREGCFFKNTNLHKIYKSIFLVSLLRALKHSNIVRLYQIVHQAHSLILVFEYMVSIKSHSLKHIKRIFRKPI